MVIRGLQAPINKAAGTWFLLCNNFYRSRLEQLFNEENDKVYFAVGQALAVVITESRDMT
eukprot:scaffold659986_cov71-Prasinocladus_malaysianus.AAC.1